jgi:hypothetical protein
MIYLRVSKISQEVYSIAWKVLAFQLSLITVSVLIGCNSPVSQPMPGNVPSVPVNSSTSTFPLQIKDSEPYLYDNKGKPFLICGDAAWSLLVQLDREDINRYLSDRKNRGFNTLLINMIEHHFSDNPPHNAYGETPFLEATDYSRPNEKYFEHVDWVLTRAAELGFLILLTPSYTGYGGGSQGWYEEMRENGDERLRAYGRYLGMRYKKLSNIIWVHGGDYNPPKTSLIEAILYGLKEMDPSSLHSYHGSRGTSARSYLKNADWLDLNNIYTSADNVIDEAESQYKNSQLPFVFIEGRYEGEGADEALVRTQAYQALLSGACGELMGNKLIWPFEKGWEGALNSPGARSMTHMRQIMEALPFWRFRPVFEGLIISGIGTGASRAVSAIEVERRRAVIYIPSRRTIVLDLKILSGGTAKSYWIDPASGQRIPEDDFSILDKNGLLEVSTKGRNSSGFSDWILVIGMN